MKKFTIFSALLPFLLFPVISVHGQKGFTTPDRQIDNFSVRQGYRLDQHPRFLADVNGDNQADVVAFGHRGVYVSYSTGTGFEAPVRKLPNFSYVRGWRVDQHPRMMADVNGDNQADIVGFAESGVYVSYSTGTGFTEPQLEVEDFGINDGWLEESHPRFMADVNGDNRADIVGFFNNGVHVSYSTGTGFMAPELQVEEYGRVAGGWRVDRHPRFLADVNGDKQADIVGFSSFGVDVSFSTGTDFTAPARVLSDYGYEAGYRVDQHPRFLADVNGDKQADIVVFGNRGVYVSYSTGTGFTAPVRELPNFSYVRGWRVDQHPRMMADVNGDNQADIVGIIENGVHVSYSNGTGFTAPEMEVEGYGYDDGWRVDQHLRLVTDVNGDKRADIVGFGGRGVIVSYSYEFNEPYTWDKAFAKTSSNLGDHVLKAAFQTADGGYFLAGTVGENSVSINPSVTNSGDIPADDFKSGTNGNWIIKTNSRGNMEWDKIYGISWNDDIDRYQLATAIPTTDGGYLLAGSFYSSQRGSDYWIVKTDNRGNMQWEKKYGGNGTDELASVVSTSDGGYLLAGTSNSRKSGDKSQNSFTRDYWILKINNEGSRQWDKTYGGISDDELASVISTTDGGYLLAGKGNTFFNLGKGGYDYWIVKTDNQGNKEWDKRYGGSRNDELVSAVSTTDGGYLLAGTSNSRISNDKSEDGLGRDYWIVKINNSGTRQWDKTFRSITDDELASVITTSDGGFLLAGKGSTAFNLGKGGYDYRIVKTDNQGTMQADKRYGGSGNDELATVVSTSDGGYLLAGSSQSPKSGDKTKPLMSRTDYWILKIGIESSYYVSTTGNNSNPGTITAPLRTIQHALDLASPGTTIYVRGGTYNERLVWKNSGSPAALITLTNYKAELAYLDGNNATNDKQSALLDISSKSNLRLNGLRIRNNFRSFALGIYLHGAGTNVQVSNCRIYNIGWTTNESSMPASGDNANPFIIVGNSPASYNNLLISSNEIFNNITGYSESLTITGNVENFRVEKNKVHHNTNIGIVIAGHYPWTESEGAENLNQARNGKVIGNTVYNCVSQVATSAGIYVDGGKMITIEGNYCYANGTGISLGCENDNRTASDINVRSNFIYNNRGAGIMVGANASGSKVESSTINNNTFFKNYSVGGHGGEIHLLNTHGISLKSNIIYSRSNVAVIALEQYASTELAMNYNHYYTASASSNNIIFDWHPIDSNNKDYSSLAAFQSGTGLEANGRYANPLVVNPTLPTPDLHLSASSPAINSGDPDYIPTTDEKDFDGEVRRQSTRVDVGADETSFTNPPSIVRMASFSEFRSLKLYPNPAKDYFYLDSDALIRIQSATGEVLHRGNYRKGEQVNISYLPNGLYFVVDETSKLTIRLLIN